MKQFNQTIALIVLITILCFISNWIFNHVNVWLGILSYIIWIWYLTNKIINFLNNQNNEKN